MSCDGTMIGLPLAGERMLLVDIIRTRASSWASRLNGTCTAIWSPSKSALNAAQKHRMLADHRVDDVRDFLALRLDPLLRLRQGHGETLCVETRVEERLEQ